MRFALVILKDEIYCEEVRVEKWGKNIFRCKLLRRRSDVKRAKWIDMVLGMNKNNWKLIHFWLPKSAILQILSALFFSELI